MRTIITLIGCFMCGCTVGGAANAPLAPGIEKECVDGVSYLISAKAGIAPQYKPDGTLVECPEIVYFSLSSLIFARASLISSIPFRLG